MIFMDGTRITPGTEGCKCGPRCEHPCFLRIGIAPACQSCGCPPLPEEDEE